MDYCTAQPQRRHNPVDSICRKLQTIQRRGEREPNSPFQIPKFSSSSYDSPQCGLRDNLEAILKKRAVRGEEGERERERGGGRGMLTPTASPRDLRSNSGLSAAPPSTSFSALFTPATNPPTPGNVTFTITSTLGERRGAAGGASTGTAGGLGQGRTWQRYCSTPAAQTNDSSSSRFTFSRGAQFTQLEGERQQSRSPPPPLTRTNDQTHGILSYNLNFCSAESGSPLECELPYPALVVKRLSMGDGGSTLSSESRKETMAEVSLICEEDLLDTIFHACDTQRRGKVYVSRIVDYLRHTTSRSSEDSGLEELCNMLDPDQRDVSIDLDTYHAIMREWIEDCRNNGEEPTDDLTQDSLKAKRSMLLNMTSGSLEAFGGETSRADLETSELVYCVADLQLSNQKLEEEVRKLKATTESMEEANQRLVEDNEELRNQARVSQQLAQKEKMLSDEVEEMKATLTCTEEGRARASAHSKRMERENHSLIAKIAFLQEENLKVTMEIDELQRKMVELCEMNTDLQVQIHSFDAVMSDKEAVIREKSRQIAELKAAVEEYSSVTELLRADKTKLESQMHMMLPDMVAAGLSLSVAYRFNQSSSGSLQTELALAQTPPEGAERLLSNLPCVSPLDETLDREVLLLLQGPSPEYLSLQFRSLLQKLKRDFREDAVSVFSTLKDLVEDYGPPEASADDRLNAVQGELVARREDWALGLDRLEEYTDSLEKELIKMAGNMRRSRTEILHLSVRVQEQQNQRRQLCEELEQLKNPQDSRGASCQTPDTEQEPGEDLDWDEEFAFQDILKSELKQRNYSAQDGRTDCRPNETTDRLTDRGGEEEEGEERWTVVARRGEEARGTSTPVFAHNREAQPGQSTEGEGQACPDTEPEVNCQPPQEEEEVPEDAHTQAAGVGHRQIDALPDPSHSESSNAENLDATKSLPGGSTRDLSITAGQDQTITSGNTPPRQDQMVPPNSTSPGPDDTISQTGSPQPASGNRRGEGGGGGGGGGGGESRGGEADSPRANMSFTKGPSQDQLAERGVVEDSTSLLPVLEEEEEGLQDPVQAPTVQGTMAGTDRLAGSGTATLSDGSSSQSTIGPTVTYTNQSAGSVGGTASDSNQSEGSVSAPSELSEAKVDSLSVRGKSKRELSRSMEAIEEHKVQEDLSETSSAAEKEAETSVLSEADDSMRDDRSSLSQSDKEVETEFQRLSLGFKCDMFTLEKRLRLEERSRDLAEENVRREISSCQGLLQALIPLCEDDNQSMEIIQRLQKNLDILIQSMTRVSSRSEMLGAIHQESRIGKAVEVMIQHVENLRRMYTKEHAELMELRETMMQNERSFGSHCDRDDFRSKKQSGSQYYKSSARRVSIAAIPRSGGGNMHFDMPKTQDTPEAEAERLTRRSPWNVAGKSAARPPLKRYVSSGAWVDTEDPSLMMMMKGPVFVDTDSQSEEEQREEPVVNRERRLSSLTELGAKLASLILPLKTPSPSSSPTIADPGTAPCLAQSLHSSRATVTAAVTRGSRGLWLWLAMVLVLAGLLALLASLMMQPAVDAAPVGTGDSWMTIQQLLWPYTGLRHNGQPPV